MGPTRYQLQNWSSKGVVLDVVRDLTYPLGVRSFDNYAISCRAYVTKIERQDDRMTLLVDMELVMKYQRSYDILRQPLQSVSPDVVKRSAPQLRYLIIDAVPQNAPFRMRLAPPQVSRLTTQDRRHPEPASALQSSRRAS
jgi:hypothetical protein